MSQNNTEHRIHNLENSPYQVSKPCVKLYKNFEIKQTQYNTPVTKPCTISFNTNLSQCCPHVPFFTQHDAAALYIIN
jgi:hypothetical protein